MARIDMSSLGGYIREQRHLAQVSLRQLSSAAGVSNPYLSQVERGLRRPSAEILQQIAKGLQISAEQLYVRAGILEPRDEGAQPSVDAAILGDPQLTERQKRALLDVYAAFKSENLRPEPTPSKPAPRKPAPRKPAPRKRSGTTAAQPKKKAAESARAATPRRQSGS
jgi:transcriptional regulator with XRE-family HTH domain